MPYWLGSDKIVTVQEFLSYTAGLGGTVEVATSPTCFTVLPALCGPDRWTFSCSSHNTRFTCMYTYVELLRN